MLHPPQQPGVTTPSAPAPHCERRTRQAVRACRASVPARSPTVVLSACCDTSVRSLYLESLDLVFVKSLCVAMLWGVGKTGKLARASEGRPVPLENMQKLLRVTENVDRPAAAVRPSVGADAHYSGKAGELRDAREAAAASTGTSHPGHQREQAPGGRNGESTNPGAGRCCCKSSSGSCVEGLHVSHARSGRAARRKDTATNTHQNCQPTIAPTSSHFRARS